MNFIITGASQGIGLSLVHEVMKNKENKVVAIARNQEKLKKIEQSSQYSARLKSIPFDITSPYEKYETLKKEINVFFDGNVSILINNAGALFFKDIQEISMEEIEIQFQTNTLAPIKMTKCMVGLFKKGGHIVNIGSMAGLQNAGKVSGLSVYSSTKGAIASFSEGVAVELLPKHIFVNCLMLGSVDTEMFQTAFPGVVPVMNPDDIAKWIVDFSINATPCMTGKVVPISTPRL